MTFYYRLWHKPNINIDKVKTIDEIIEFYRSMASQLNTWKRKGIFMDGTSKKEGDGRIRFYTTDLQVANEEGFVIDEFKSELDYHTYKIGVYSKYPIIVGQFIKSIHGIRRPSRHPKGTVTVTESSLAYKTPNEHLTLQFQAFQEKNKFQSVDYVVMAMRQQQLDGIIFFYHLAEKLETRLVGSLTGGGRTQVPIVCVGYDSPLPEHPEEVDSNNADLNSLSGLHQLCYISTDNPQSMFQVLDLMVQLIKKR